jgi:hypothetical protein
MEDGDKNFVNKKLLSKTDAMQTEYNRLLEEM